MKYTQQHVTNLKISTWDLIPSVVKKKKKYIYIYMKEKTEQELSASFKLADCLDP